MAKIIYWKIDEKLLNHIAKIARLKLTSEEKRKFLSQLQEILDVFKKIEKVDTKGVKPSFHPLEIKNVWREDRIKRWKWSPLAHTKHKELKWLKGPCVV
jgi:aspartyl-tRNA(Asn)/glutamyl-tRNA(Gln) amidotransferase subunit C